MNKDGSKIAFISDEENALVFQYIGNENWSQIGQAIEIDNGLSPNWQGIYGITISGDGSTIAMNMDNCPDPQDMDCDDIVAYYTFKDGNIYLSAIADRITTKKQGNSSPVCIASIYPSKHAKKYYNTIIIYFFMSFFLLKAFFTFTLH